MAEFLGKRAVGALNVAVNRRRKHKMELLAALADDVRELAPDHLALTGDLSNVSLDAEWRVALRWIEGLERSPADVTVIPGNHDAYVAQVVAERRFETMFAAYQSPGASEPSQSSLAPEGEGRTEGRGEEARATDYPFLRRRGPVALIGVNSCVATGDLGAWGEVGQPQLERLERLLAAPQARAAVRVVLIHHPPVRIKGGEDRNLKDRAAFAAVLARAGAELVIHGHDHQDESSVLEGPGGRTVPVIGAGSASYAGGPDRRARYNVYEIDGARITLAVRVHDEARARFVEAKRLSLVA